jgi:hypothetical protein
MEPKWGVFQSGYYGGCDKTCAVEVSDVSGAMQTLGPLPRP